MEKQRRSEDQAVDAVENAAIAGQQRAGILEAEIAFDAGNGQVAEKAAERNGGAEKGAKARR